MICRICRAGERDTVMAAMQTEAAAGAMVYYGVLADTLMILVEA